VISTAQDKTPERGGNDGADGKARKTKNRFPSLFHRALGNRCRDSHIPTAPVTVFLFSKPKRKEPWLPTLIWSVQAHSSMRKCSKHSLKMQNDPIQIGRAGALACRAETRVGPCLSLD
jgi:hypothetical protein